MHTIKSEFKQNYKTNCETNSDYFDRTGLKIIIKYLRLR